MLIFNSPLYVYAIQHNTTKRIYVGSTHKLKDRYWSHIYQLRNHSHYSQEMQADFDKYGEDFSIFILEKVEENTAHKDREYFWMDKLGTRDTRIGYNNRDRHYNHESHKGVDMTLPLKDGIPIPNKIDD